MAKPAAASALVVLTDLCDPAVLAATKQGLLQFCSALCLQTGVQAAPPAPPAPAAAAACSGIAVPPVPRLVLGLCSLARPPGAPKPVLQVRYRPGPFVLRDFHAAVSRLAHSGDATNTGADGAISGATAAAALQQLVGVVAQDAACAAAGPHKTVLLLTDRVEYEPSDFYASLEVCKSKGVRLELVLLDAATPEGSSASGSKPAVMQALAAAWEAAEAAFPHLSVTIVQGASRLSFSALASTLLQRYSPQPPLAVSLQFKQPLVGSIRSLPLSCAAELRPLSQAVCHAVLCPCHHTPASWSLGGAAPLCSITGVPLDRRQCGRDERTVQVGGSAAGALHLSAPFNIAAVAGAAGGGAATLSILSRVKVEQANPALLFGVPLMLVPAGTAAGPAGMSGGQGGQAGTFKVVHEGEIVDVTTSGLLGLLCSSLRASGEALLAVSSTDLACGAAGLLRLHYLLLPCEPGGSRLPTLCAKRVACAEELLAPLMAPTAEQAAPLPLAPAVAEAVAAQLAAVPLADRLDPLALSSRCGEVVEMLVRESQPMPKAQAPAAAPAPPPAAAQLPALAGTTPQQQPVAAAQAAAAPVAAAPPAAPAAPAVNGRRLAVGGAARESGGRANGKQQAGGKGGLELRRTGRR